MAGTEPLWTISELGQRAAAVLAAAPDYRAPANGQVRAVPDRRTIRYYTTLGLLDRPAEMQGRTALYGPRHLMQLVAIKRLQAEGLSLARIQAKLTGSTRKKLAALAAVPEAALAGPAADRPKGAARAGVERFWSALPADTDTDTDTDTDSDTDPTAAPRAAMQVRVELAPGISVTIDGDRPLSGEELAALHAAARPLVDRIQRTQHRGLEKPRGTTVEPGGE